MGQHLCKWMSKGLLGSTSSFLLMFSFLMFLLPGNSAEVEMKTQREVRER